MSRLCKLLVLPLALGLAACEAPTVETDDTVPTRLVDEQDARAEIEKINDLWTQYYNAGDSDSLIGLYADDAIVVCPHGRLRGLAEIEADLWEHHIEGDQSTSMTDYIEVSDSGACGESARRWPVLSARRQ